MARLQRGVAPKRADRGSGPGTFPPRWNTCRGGREPAIDGPAFRGTLRHKGWRVVEAKLPTLAEGVDRTVIAPAEVELSA